MHQRVGPAHTMSGAMSYNIGSLQRVAEIIEHSTRQGLGYVVYVVTSTWSGIGMVGVCVCGDVCRHTARPPDLDRPPSSALLYPADTPRRCTWGKVARMVAYRRTYPQKWPGALLPARRTGHVSTSRPGHSDHFAGSHFTGFPGQESFGMASCTTAYGVANA